MRSILLCAAVTIGAAALATDFSQQINTLKEQGQSDFQAYFNLGNQFFYKKNLDNAILCYEKSISFNNSVPQSHLNLGIALKQKNQLNKSLIALRSAVTLKPAYAKAHFYYAQTLKELGHTKEAINEYKITVEQEPKNIQAHRDLAEIYAVQQQTDKAIDQLKKVLIFNPHDYTVCFRIGYLATTIGDIEQAVEHYDMIPKKSPYHLQATYNCGYALKMVGRIDEAIEKYKEVLTKKPDYDPAHLALGFAYLNKGDFECGWPQHERYLKRSNKNADRLRLLLEKNNLKGATIFLRPEGGLGDSIQFIRYAQLLKEMGAHVIVSIQKPLAPLFANCPYIDQLLCTGEPIPPHHAYATLMSLPAVFYANEETIPRNIPYMFPNKTLETYWREQLAHDKKFKIGLCWQADVHNDSSRLPVAHRGIPLKKLLPLGTFEQISLYSLQKKDGVEQLAQLPKNFPLHIFDNSFDETHGPFMDTAAVMKQLDLVITVDTAIAHLAGALGVPVWLLLPYSTDWRWLINRIDSPWYPTMKIFKQPAPFDWNSVVEDVFIKLKKSL